MSNKTLGIILGVVGLVILAIVILEPSLGLGTLIGYGTKHALLLVIGAIALIAGVVLFLMKRKVN
jgi:LPXTG-motif cell wall-anchored protein